MSTPITSYFVTLSATSSFVTVEAQSFEIFGNGAVVFRSPTNQTVAAFGPGVWTQVEPVVTP